MQLSVWTYEGPPHVGAMRVAAAKKVLDKVDRNTGQPIPLEGPVRWCCEGVFDLDRP